MRISSVKARANPRTQPTGSRRLMRGLALEQQAVFFRRTLALCSLCMTPDPTYWGSICGDPTLITPVKPPGQSSKSGEAAFSELLGPRGVPERDKDALVRQPLGGASEPSLLGLQEGASQ